MIYAALLSSHSEDSPGILPASDRSGAVLAGVGVVRAQPGIRYEIIQRASTAAPWTGWDGAGIRECIDRMVNR